MPAAPFRQPARLGSVFASWAGAAPGSHEGNPLILIAVWGGPLVLALLWWLGGTLIATAAWRSLARRYQAEHAFTGADVVSRRCLWLRGCVLYPFCAEVGANARGLHLSVPLLRPGHPPLLIPWTDLTTRRNRVLLWDVVEVSTTGAPGIRIGLSAQTMAAVLELGHLEEVGGLVVAEAK